MNGRNTLIAVIIFGVLLAAVLIFDPRQGGSGSAAGSPTPVPTLTSIEFEQVQQVSISASDGRKVTVRKNEDGTWSMLEPESTEADRNRITALLSQLTIRPPERKIADSAENLADYGLDSPSYVVELTTGDRSETVLFGSVNPNGTSIYTMKAGSPEVWLMGTLQTSLRDMIDRPPVAPTPTATPNADPTTENTASAEATPSATPAAGGTPTTAGQQP